MTAGDDKPVKHCRGAEPAFTKYDMIRVVGVVAECAKIAGEDRLVRSHVPSVGIRRALPRVSPEQAHAVLENKTGGLACSRRGEVSSLADFDEVAGDRGA